MRWRRGRGTGGFPDPQYAEKFQHLVETSTLLDDVIRLIPLMVALTIAISIKTLVVSVAMHSISQVRSDTNRELVGQGLGNMLAGIFGGLASTANQARSLMNYEAGGRTRLAKIFAGVAGFAVLMWLEPIVALFPRVILAAVMVSMAWKMTDRWSLNLLFRLMSDLHQWRQVIDDLLVVLTVTASLVVFGIFEGLAVGFLISLLLFFYRSSRKILRRKYTAREHRSSVDRTDMTLTGCEKNYFRVPLRRQNFRKPEGRGKATGCSKSPSARPEGVKPPEHPPESHSPLPSRCKRELLMPR